MKNEYDVHDDLSDAAQRLFGSTTAAFAFLSRPTDEPAPEGTPSERAQRLRRILTSYVKSMATELEELGPDESVRLQAEARATLIAIRELEAHIPECK